MTRLAGAWLPLRCAPALLSIGLAFWLALALAPVFNDAPVPLFVAAVAISAWAGGLGPGFLATALAGAALEQFFDLSRGATLVQTQDTVFDLLLFLGVSLLITTLTARLRTLNQRLEGARGEAEAAVRTREELLAFAAHDLKSPLTGITMSAQLARRRLLRAEVALPDGVGERLVDIEAAARRMLSLLDETLDVAHLQAGRPLRLNRAPTRLQELAEEAVIRHQPNTERHQLRVVADADPIGMWDAARLARIVDNLLSNAIKYSPRRSEITLEVSQEDRAAVLRVRDQGIGIPWQDLERVFSRFYRAGNVGAVEGTGLGLAGARQIAQQHGGSLTLASEEGVGTTVTLRLPLDQAATSQVIAPEPTPPAKMAGCWRPRAGRPTSFA
jgi:signal transduction histidine kinase